MVRHRQGGAPGSLSRGAVAVVTAWALAWAGVPAPVMALQDEGQAQKQAQAQAEEPSGESPAPAEVVAPQADEVSEVSVPVASEDDAVISTVDVVPSDSLQTADDSTPSGTWGTCNWDIDSDGKLTIHQGKGTDLGGVALIPWYNNRLLIKSVEIQEGVELPKRLGMMFFGCMNLASVSVPSNKLAGVTAMDNMFYDCHSLVSLDASGWVTSSVTDIAGMFTGCESLESINFAGWDTSSVASISRMFAACSKLSEVDVSGFDTSSVRSMWGVFYNCSALKSLNLSSWNTTSVQDMGFLFRNCSQLNELDLSGWDTSAVAKADDMFTGCSPAKVTLGQNYKMDGKAQFPQAKTGNIWKNKSGLLFTADQIMRFRSATADTYTQAVEPAGLTDISNAMVKRSWSTFIYDGTPKTPGITVVLPLLDFRTLNPDTDYVLSFSNNVNPGTATVTVTGKGNYKGTVSAVFRIINPKRVEMYRLYNPYSGEHFYTASSSERDGLSAIGWKYEGVGWVAPDSSDHPVYRLYNPYAGDHHYTMSAEERDQLKSVGWNDEGTGWYSDDAHSVGLYRQYNPYASVGTHNYTTSKEENDMLVSVGWNAEGIGWYGLA